MSDRKIIMYDSDEAATFQTVSGWVAADGHFWGKDEDMARWSGCTHKICACGGVVQKSWLICEECRETKRAEKYKAMPEAVGGGMMFSDTAQEYFWDWDEAEEYASEENRTLHDLDLIVCEPVYMSEVDDDRWSDQLPEDCQLDDVAPKEIVQKLKELNELIRATKPVLSWVPGKFRVSLADYSAPVPEDEA